jgi:hypothetical protein
MPKLKLPPHLRPLNPGVPAVVQVKTPPKYGNRRVVVNGVRFDSEREAAVYHDHALRQAAGEIDDLVAHPRYPLEAYGQLLGHYEADLSYVETATGQVVVVDVKSGPTRTPLYRLKKKLFEAQYGLTITEIE